MKKLNLKGIQSGPASARSAHAIVEIADEETLQLLSQFIEISPRFKTAEAQKETVNAQLAPRIRALFFRRFAGIKPETSTMLANVNGTQVKLITKNAYVKTVADEGALVAALGAKAVNQHFRQATLISFDFSKVPEANQEKFAAALVELAQKHGATDAITLKQCVQPVAGFHEARTSLLTPEQNDRVDSIIPVTAYPQL
jgi:hypothetical protein